MLHILYILAFTVIAFFAISNLISNLINLTAESNRRYTYKPNSGTNNNFTNSGSRTTRTVPHPELLDETGQPINEPLLVMRSVNVDDAREQLDAIYNASPGKKIETDEET
ncbi:MAG: DUF2973 domain-containing protein [Spirulinaceae cyanobacterium]